MELDKLLKALSNSGNKVYSIEVIKINYDKNGDVSVTLCPKDSKEQFEFGDIQEPNFD